jgi:hypothetical protein
LRQPGRQDEDQAGVGQEQVPILLALSFGRKSCIAADAKMSSKHNGPKFSDYYNGQLLWIIIMDKVIG